MVDAHRETLGAEVEAATGRPISEEAPALVIAASPRYWEICRKREAQKGAGWIRELERLGREVSTQIGVEASAYCFSLTRLSLPDGLTRICDAAFLNCSSLTSVQVPESTTIGHITFEGCFCLAALTKAGLQGDLFDEGCLRLALAALRDVALPTALRAGGTGMVQQGYAPSLVLRGEVAHCLLSSPDLP